MGLCGFNQYRANQRRRRKSLLRAQEQRSAVVAPVEKSSSEKHQSVDGSENELSATPIGVSFSAKKKRVIKRRKLNDKE